MSSEKLVSKVLINQGIVMLILSIFIIIISPRQLLGVLLGGIIAAVNFNMSARKSKKFLVEKSINKLNYTLSYVMRLILGVLGALVSLKMTSIGLIFYLVGYLTNFISIILYGIRLK